MSLRKEYPTRLLAAVALLMVAFALSLVFYGTAANLVVLALVVAALIASLVCVGPRHLLDLLDTNRTGLTLSLTMLGYLIVAYQRSLSPDSSFAASWVLASGPIAFLCASVVMGRSSTRRLLTASVVVVVIALAANSSARFLLFGERAHQPMVDPNNYAALLYLVWIPLVHWHLARGWQKDAMTWVRHGIMFASSFALILAIIATRSRTALVILGVAFVLWLVIVAIRRVSWRCLLVHLCVAGLAWGVAIGVTSLTDASLKGLEIGGGLAVRQELTRAALAMFAEHPLGIGVFCFSLLYPGLRSPLEQDTAGLFVHNDYLQFLVEGGVPLLVLLLLFVGSVLRRGIDLIRLAPDEPRFASLGLAIALTAVNAHAVVNFIFYALPLSIVIGLMAALLFSDPIAQRTGHAPGASRGVVALGICAAWVMWLYLALDVATVGVFQGQSSFTLAAPIREDEQRMLEFARVAQRINGNRGIPALGEALLLHRAARAEPDSGYLKEQTYRQFHRAMAVDPWNTLTYVRFSQFLEEFPPAGGRATGESDEQLLMTALGLDPLYVPALDQLLQHYAATAQDGKRYALLRNVVYPWMPRLRRNDPNATDRYFDLLEGYASAIKDTSFLAELKERRASLVDLAPEPETYWFF